MLRSLEAFWRTVSDDEISHVLYFDLSWQQSVDESWAGLVAERHKPMAHLLMTE